MTAALGRAALLLSLVVDVHSLQPIARPVVIRTIHTPSTSVALTAANDEPERPALTGKQATVAALTVGGFAYLVSTGAPGAVFGSVIFQKAAKRALGGGIAVRSQASFRS